MPHTEEKRYALVSCHVERLLDDRCWEAFSSFQRRRPGGFVIAALVRPPDERAGEDRELWLERARAAAANGPFGHHTHFVGPQHARPDEPQAAHVERVREEALWLRAQGLDPAFFCGGGWYIDEDVAEAVAELGYADCTATAFRPTYLEPGALRLGLDRPAWLALPSGRRLLELPATHSLGMISRGVLGALPPYVHVYFHDTDLLDRSRKAALRAALELLSRRSETVDLSQMRASEDAAPTVPFARAAGGGVATGA